MENSRLRDRHVVGTGFGGIFVSRQCHTRLYDGMIGGGGVQANSDFIAVRLSGNKKVKNFRAMW